MFAFSQAMNVNTDTILQHCITKCLITIVEKYISDKLKKMGEVSHIEFVEDEKRVTHLLVRTYLSNINFSSNLPPVTAHHTTTTTNEHASSNETSNLILRAETAASIDLLKRCQVFGSICTCVNYLLSINSPGGLLTPQSQNVAIVHLFMNEDSRENYIKLLVCNSVQVYSN
jgi:hypothetical protein